LTYAAAVGDAPGAVLAFLAAVLLFAVAALPGRDHVLRVVALAAGAVALFEATTVAFDGNAETAALLGQGVVLLVVAAVLRSRPLLVVGGIVGLTGVLSTLAGRCRPRRSLRIPRLRSSWASPCSGRRWWLRQRCRPWCWPRRGRADRIGTDRHPGCGRPGGAAVGACRVGRALRRGRARDRARAARGAVPGGLRRRPRRA
jgi:hypothetical protein